jgi:hypothetical protein
MRRQAMERKSAEKPPPKSTDLDGWRAAIEEGDLSRFRPEAIAAAFQDLGAQDPAVRRALTKQLSGIIVGMLRKRVDPARPDNGNDVIFQVHEQIFRALLQPKTADGKALREAFGRIVIFRMFTALADEERGRIVPAPKFQRRPEDGNAHKPGIDDEAEGAEATDETEAFPPTVCEDEEAAPGKQLHDPELLREVQACDEQIDRDRLLKRVLGTIPTYKKRLAYYLYLHGVPAKSKKEDSIAKACGVDEKTVRKWIDEIENDLKQNEEIRALLRATSGARS